MVVFTLWFINYHTHEKKPNIKINKLCASWQTIIYLAKWFVSA